MYQTTPKGICPLDKKPRRYTSTVKFGRATLIIHKQAAFHRDCYHRNLYEKARKLGSIWSAIAVAESIAFSAVISHNETSDDLRGASTNDVRVLKMRGVPQKAKAQLGS